MTVRVRVADTDRAYDAPEGEDLLEILQKNEHPIATACGGVASCGHCRLVVVGGMQLLSPIAASELVHLGNVAKVIGARLACQSRVCSTAGDVVVRVPDVADAEERRRRKAERARLDRRPRDGVVATAASATPPAARPRAGGIEWRPGRIHRPPSPKDGSGSPEV